jgi:plastocyanin
MISARVRPFLTLASVAVLWSLAGSAPARAAAADAAQITITIKDFMFTPMSLTVKAGSTVMWGNKDQEPHTVVSDSGVFRSGALDTDETFSFKFDQPGIYHFRCSMHPQMLGTIVVE